jgi:hypothetical protein
MDSDSNDSVVCGRRCHYHFLILPALEEATNIKISKPQKAHRADLKTNSLRRFPMELHMCLFIVRDSFGVDHLAEGAFDAADALADIKS